LKGGGDVGSRVRIAAAAACIVASGLLAGGASVAVADSPHSGGGGDTHTNGSSDDGYPKKPKSHRDEKKTTPGGDGREERPGTDPVDPKAEDDTKDGDKQDGDDGSNGDNNNGGNGTGNPGNGNCGNSGGNGNAKGCGRGGGDDPDDPSPPSKPPDQKPPPGEPPEKPGGCEEDNKVGCSPGWPWWPWPWQPGEPPGPGGGGGGGGAPEVPSGRPALPPAMQLPSGLMPPATEPVEPSVIDVVPGVGTAAVDLPIAPITLPVIVAPAAGLGAGGGPAGPALPEAPRGVSAEPPAGRRLLPANVGSNVSLPAASYRIGYTDYLRSAGLSQVAALAVPGVAGMLVLTGAGGLVGYRQAKAGHAVRTSGIARFVN
jgi:hypothetical protein